MGHRDEVVEVRLEERLVALALLRAWGLVPGQLAGLVNGLGVVVSVRLEIARQGLGRGQALPGGGQVLLEAGAQFLVLPPCERVVQKLHPGAVEPPLKLRHLRRGGLGVLFGAGGALLDRGLDVYLIRLSYTSRAPGGHAKTSDADRILGPSAAGTTRGSTR